jgi:hypothetical protein
MNAYPYAGFTSTTPWPISTGEILNRVWSTLRGNLKLFLGLGVPSALCGLLTIGILAGALFAAGVLPPHPDMNPNPAVVAPWVFAAITLCYVPSLIVFALYQAATAFAALRAAEGRRTTVGEAYSAAMSKAGRYIGLMLLQYLCISGPILVVALLLGGCWLLIFSMHGNETPAVPLALMGVVFPLYFAAMAYAIWMGLRLGMAFPASVAENLPAVAALKRSAKLSYRVKGTLFLSLLVVYLIGYVAVFVIEIGGAAIGAVAALVITLAHLGMAAGIAIAVVLGSIFLVAICLYSALLWAAFILCFTVVYCDQRPRIDGPVGGLAAGFGPASGGPASGGVVPA